MNIKELKKRTLFFLLVFFLLIFNLVFSVFLVSRVVDKDAKVDQAWEEIRVLKREHKKIEEELVAKNNELLEENNNLNVKVEVLSEKVVLIRDSLTNLVEKSDEANFELLKEAIKRSDIGSKPEEGEEAEDSGETSDE